MKILLSFALIFCSSLAIASRPPCWDLIMKHLKEPSEKYLFTVHPVLHSFIDCEQPGFGLPILIHEASHFEDLGIPHYASAEDIQLWWEEGRFFEFSLYSLDGKKHGEMSIKNAPKPQMLILKFLKRNHPEVMANESHTIHSFVEGYLNDPDVYSSYLFTKGLVTELNAYTHGLRIESRYPAKRDSANQRYGVLSFLIFFKAYIYEAKTDTTLWIQLKRPENSKYMQLLFKQAARMLKLTNHCQNMNDFERKDLHGLLIVESSLGPLRELLQDEHSLREILCH
jgi:hypothetical protein